jgi:hypothetical protein
MESEYIINMYVSFLKMCVYRNLILIVLTNKNVDCKSGERNRNGKKEGSGAIRQRRTMIY